jgi:hypothetical protein
MRSLIKKILCLSPLLLGAMQATAQQLDISVEIPRLQVAEYHRPYLAIWVEKESGGVAANLAVWYDIKLKDDKGLEWLKDMRQWWRRTGRDLAFPIDGVTGATRAPGKHSLQFVQGREPLGQLPEGNYRLMVEAAREVGGREVLQLPFSWPPESEQQSSVSGSSELGEFSFQIKP